MTSWLIILALSLVVQVVMTIFFIDLVGRGRLFSRPLWRFRLFAPRIGYTMLLSTWTRMMQIAVLSIVSLSVVVITKMMLPNILYGVVLISLYIDDYYTGDDDRWLRFMKWLKRWRATRRALRRKAFG